MSDMNSKGVNVRVKSTYRPERSFPGENYYFFSYRVTVRNDGRETVQLLSRRWIITDADGNVQEVQGKGVVGEQPVLGPGESFEYTSFCPLKTAVGSMHGSYGMKTSSGEEFHVTIHPFTLAVPTAVN